MYFRNWEQKIKNGLHQNDGDHNYNENFFHDYGSCDVKADVDSDWKPTQINIVKKKLKKGKITKGKVKKQKPCPQVRVKGEEKENEGPLKCDHCEYVGTNKRYMQKHLKRHEDNSAFKGKARKELQIISCLLCEYSTKSDLLLKKHQKEVHKQQLVCEKCSEKFDDLSEYAAHSKQHTTQCSICGKTVVERYLENHIEKMHGESSTKFEICTKCGLSIKAISMAAHVAKVHGTKCYPCPHCDYAPRTMHDLNRHIKRKHTAANILNCPWCGRLTKDLDRHLKSNQCNIPEEERTKQQNITCNEREN